MPNILISGEHSFIGNSFRKYSSFRNVKLISLKRIKPEEVDFSGIDVVIHLSAIVHSTEKISSTEYFHINRDLAIIFAKCAKSAGVKQFIFLSTVKVYGKYEPGTVWSETSECKPTDYYGISKHQAEIELKTLANDSFSVSIIRTPLVYGPGNKANMQKLFRLVKLMPILPFRRTDNLRHFNYIENLVSFIDRLIEVNISGTFISTDNEHVSTSELVLFISEAQKKHVILISFPSILKKIIMKVLPSNYERLFGSFIIDNTFTRNTLNFKPMFSTKEGIHKTLNTKDL